MGAVHLHRVEAGLLDPSGRLCILLHQFLDFFGAELDGQLPCGGIGVGGHRHRLKTRGVLRKDPSVVVDLRNRQGAMSLNGLCHHSEPWNELVLRHPHAEGPVLGGPFNEQGLQDDHTGAPSGSLPIVVPVSLAGKAVAVSHVGVHGRHHDPILGCQPTDFYGFKKVSDLFIHEFTSKLIFVQLWKEVSPRNALRNTTFLTEN